MDITSDVREFLMTRRSRITLAQAGLPAYGGTRRVAGLKREEVAMLTKAAAPASASGVRRPRSEVRPSIYRLLAGMTGTPAYVRNARMDVVAANSLCFALYTDILSPGTGH